MPVIIQLSDLNIDINAKQLNVCEIKLINAIVSYFKEIESEYDVLLFAGNLFSNMHHSINFLKKIHEVCPYKIIKFVPGNYELIEYKDNLIQKKFSSDLIYKLYKESIYSLEQPFQLSSKTILIGGVGWYDYSFLDYAYYLKKSVPLSEIYSFKKKHCIDKDVIFEKDDIEFCKEENKRYKELIETYPHKNIYLLNHFVPFKKYLKTNHKDMHCIMKTAFYGSTYLENLIEDNENVCYVGFGHINEQNGIEYIKKRTEICYSLSYCHQWKNKITENMTETQKINVYIEELRLITNKFYVS